MYQEVKWTAEVLSTNIKFREIQFQSIGNLLPTRWYQVVKTMALPSWISSFNHKMRRSHKLVPCRWRTLSTANHHQIIIVTIEETSQNTLKRRLICRARGQPQVPLPKAISTYQPRTTQLITNACKHSKITWKRYNKTLNELRKFLASSRAVTLLPCN